MKIKELGTKPASPKNRLRNLNHLNPGLPKLGTKQLKISGHKRPRKIDQRLQENFVQNIIKNLNPKMLYLVGELVMGNIMLN